MKFRLTELARKDLKNIAIYTQKNFGKKQRYKYLKSLDDAFYKIAENPKIGRQREEFTVEMKCYLCDQHFVFYRKKSGLIEIVRILATNMDIKSHLYK